MYFIFTENEKNKYFTLHFYSKGFKKAWEKDIDIQYTLPNIVKVQLGKGYGDCYEIIEEILFKSLG